MFVDLSKMMRPNPEILWIITLFLLLPAVTYAKEQVENKMEPRTREAVALMLGFARRTGLDSEQTPQRYLWTDAFAVCNFLALARESGEDRYLQLALRLVEQVHHILGHYRDDDRRSGWISGLDPASGEQHPTRGGLRIGKQLPERGPDEPYDERLEWERDGQYFHYLAKWMHALDHVSRVTGDPKYNVWARELALAAYDGFTYQDASSHTRQMYWKMSTDLTRPLVSSMGQHDPLEGYLTAVQLQASVAALTQPAAGSGLDGIIRQYALMTEGSDLASPDPLGIGGLLADAYRVMQLMGQGGLSDADLLEHLLAAAHAGLDYFAHSSELQASAHYRLAFRELGLGIGLASIERMEEAFKHDGFGAGPGVPAQLEALHRYVHLGVEIESFWRKPGNQDNSTWLEHRDINEVMLATLLVPDGFLVLDR